MEFKFENQGTATYLVYQLKEEDELDSMDLGMITNNKIPGFAPTIFTQMDAAKFIKYNVSAKISAKQMFSGQVNKKRLIGVFRGIVNAMVSAEDYMIDPNSIILDMEYIYADVSTCDTVVLCLPIKSQNTEPRDLGLFFKTIMFSTQFDQTENCDHVAKIISYLNSTPVFSASGFKDLLDSIDREQYAAPRPTQPVQQATPVKEQSVQLQTNTQVMSQPVQKPISQPVTQPVSQPVLQPAPMVKPAPVAQQQVSRPNGNVQIPNVTPAANNNVQATQPAGANGKKISMLDLLMHYSKENKELYAAQKEAEKKGKATKQSVAPKQSAQSKVGGANVAIPGKSNGSITIPGKAGAIEIPGKSAPVIPTMQQSPEQPAVSQPQPVVTPQVQQVAPSVNVQPIQSQPVMVNNNPPSMKPANFGATTVLNAAGEKGGTTVLDQSMLQANTPQGPYLHRLKNDEKIYITKPEFKIGKERSFVDYFVADNTAVSRSHASIITENGAYFIMDTNSTNHTYINGGMIQSNVKTRLEHDTKIRLANEEFEFKMY